MPPVEKKKRTRSDGDKCRRERVRKCVVYPGRDYSAEARGEGVVYVRPASSLSSMYMP